MSIGCRCPSCGRVSRLDSVPAGPHATCPVCDHSFRIPHATEPDNPYAAPAASIGADALPELGPIDAVSGGFVGKFILAIRLFFENLAVIAPLVRVIWLPGALVCSALEYASEGPNGVNPLAGLQLNNIILGVFGPIYGAGIVPVLARRLAGERTSIGHALGAGLRDWGRLFGARFGAAILTGLGFIALIVPGIICMVRFSLIDPIVVLERHPNPRSRSAALVTGNGWQILGTFLLFNLIFVPIAIGLQAAISLVEPLNNLWLAAIAGCASDALGILINIVLFLYYVEAKARETASAPSEPPIDFSKFESL